MNLPSRLLRETRGGSATEFAVIVPVFFALVFAVIHLSFILWAETSLHWATETAARCASINSNVGTGATGACATAGATTNATVKAYATTQYHGPNVTPVFTANTTATCGKLVSATATYQLNVVVTSVAVNLNAKSCYP